MNLKTYYQYKKSIEYCTFCPKMCRFVCPVALAESKETLTPATKMSFLYLLGKGYKEPIPELIEAIYKCTGCLHCFTYCGHKNMIMHVYYSARDELKSHAGKNIASVIEKYRDNYRRTSSPFGEKLIDKFKEIQLLSKSRGREILFFPGCTEVNFYSETTKRIFQLIKKIYPSAEFIQGDNFCCGFPLLNVGLMDEFQDNASKISQELNKFKLVITNCPACAFILKNVYSQTGITLKPRILTVIEMITGVLDKISQVYDNKEAIYHDPCYLSRYHKIISEPRKILQRIGYKIVEYGWNGIDSECCGASLSALFPELSQEIANRRLNQLDDSLYNEKPLITACPSCRRRFFKSTNRDILDVADEFAKIVI